MRVTTITLFGLFVGLTSLNAFADKHLALVDKLTSCKKISNDKQRLSCFDQLTRKNVVSANSVEMSNETVSPVEKVQHEEAKIIDDFAKEDLKKTEEEKGPDSITATISSVKQLLRGQWVIYLENGQKWQQKDSGRIKLKVGDHIRLKKGTMGAVYLFKEGSSRNIRVKRLK